MYSGCSVFRHCYQHIGEEKCSIVDTFWQVFILLRHIALLSYTDVMKHSDEHVGKEKCSIVDSSWQASTAYLSCEQ